MARSGRIKIGIADFAVSSDESMLTMSGLGSCIGAALYDLETGVLGLAHMVLPEADDGNESAKPVDTGIELPIVKMQVVGVDTDRIVVEIARGSAMFGFTSVDGDDSIGDRNVAAARTILNGFDIDVVAENVGGSYGRSPELGSEADDFHVRSTKSGTHIP